MKLVILERDGTINFDGAEFITSAEDWTPLPGALKNVKPAGAHAIVSFDLDNPDLATFDSFHEKLQEVIKKAPEWQRHFRADQPKARAAAPAGSGFDDMDDDIPF